MSQARGRTALEQRADDSRLRDGEAPCHILVRLQRVQWQRGHTPVEDCDFAALVADQHCPDQLCNSRTVRWLVHHEYCCRSLPAFIPQSRRAVLQAANAPDFDVNSGFATNDQHAVCTTGEKCLAPLTLVKSAHVLCREVANCGLLRQRSDCSAPDRAREKVSALIEADCEDCLYSPQCTLQKRART